MTITDIANINWKNGIEWCSDIETGHEQIDGQHKHIFKLLGDLVEECENKKDVNTLKILNFLADYVVEHFAEEEALQVKYDFPHYREHKLIHEDFKISVNRLLAEYMKYGGANDITNEVYITLIRWLIKHIMGEDVKIAEHIRYCQHRA